MSHQRIPKQIALASGVLALLLAGASSVSFGIDGCQPTTPCPCAADGICKPNRTTWGVYSTRWRPWPGEQLAETPDAAGEVQGETGLNPPPYLLPKPEQEDLRGPAKKKKDRDTSDEDDATTIPAADPQQVVPEAEVPAGDDFDPFGSQVPAIPSMDDSPPALPASLRQAAAAMSIPVGSRQLTNYHVPARQQPTAVPSHSVRQASWQQPHSIQLINPASAVVTEPGADSLQQAIYYEASDNVE